MKQKFQQLEITNLSKKEIIRLQREINILSKLDHPSFLRFIGYSPIDFNQQPNPIVVTEMPYNQSLNDLLNVERNETHIGEWNDTKKLINIYGIASGMAYLHSNNVIHRNLSPESIFLDDYLFPKIVNFGLLTKIHTIATMTYQTTIGIKGNPSYSSPELLEINEYSKRSDIYAFALIVYEIMTLEIPFKTINNFNNLFNEIVKRSKRPKLDKNIPDCYRQIIELCWSQNPEDRPTFEEITSILKNEKGFITKNVNEEEFKQYMEFIEKSKIDFYSENRVVKFDNIIKSKDDGEHQLKDSTLSQSNRKTMVKEFNHIYDDLLNRKSIGSINSEVKNYLLQNSESISTSSISLDFKVIIGISTSDTDYIMSDVEKIKKMISLYKIINNLNHPCIAKSLGFFTGNDESPSFLFEYYSHKLRNVVESIDDIYLVTLVCEISHAIMHVHSKKLIHRNLNIENILLILQIIQKFLVLKILS